jgi:hypothetical protein
MIKMLVVTEKQLFVSDELTGEIKMFSMVRKKNYFIQNLILILTFHVHLNEKFLFQNLKSVKSDIIEKQKQVINVLSDLLYVKFEVNYGKSLV